MDSISQFVLGASVSYALLGKKIGPKSILIGGVGASLPDLDGIFTFNADMVSQLVHHRGFTHSIIFCLSAPFAFSFLSKKLFKAIVSFKLWYLYWFLLFFTHTLLDCFTSWGTQLFWPHPYRVSFHSIFIIDPFYTVPLIIGLCLSYFKSSFRYVSLALVISTVYLCLSLGVKQYVNVQFEKGLDQAGIEYTDYITKPTPFNIFLWQITVNSSEYYYYGYFSIFDKKKPVLFDRSKPKGHALIQKYSENRKMQQLLHFASHYYIVENFSLNHLIIYDARYGRFGDWSPDFDGVYIFTYLYNENTDTFVQDRPEVEGISTLLKDMVYRIFSN